MPVIKYDRKGYKPRPRQLLLTSNSAIIAEEGKLKQRINYDTLKGQRSTARGWLIRPLLVLLWLKHRRLSIAGISVSSLSDGLFVLHVPSDDNKQKVKPGRNKKWTLLLGHLFKAHALTLCACLASSQGDVILQSDHVIETLTKIIICADKFNSININQGRWEAVATQGSAVTQH